MITLMLLALVSVPSLANFNSNFDDIFFRPRAKPFYQRPARRFRRRNLYDAHSLETVDPHFETQRIQQDKDLATKNALLSCSCQKQHNALHE